MKSQGRNNKDGFCTYSYEVHIIKCIEKLVRTKVNAFRIKTFEEFTKANVVHKFKTQEELYEFSEKIRNINRTDTRFI